MSIITISPGTAITGEDIAQFNAQWTTPDQHTKALDQAYWWFYNRDESGSWTIGDHMAALARIHEITRDQRYLDQLREFIEYALQFRDDNHPGDIRNTGQLLPVQPVDEFRGRVMPAWGSVSVNYGGFHATYETTAGLYAYPIAAFARIVAENAGLHAAYGQDAVRYTNEVLKTALAFLPYFDFRQVGNFNEGYITYPVGQQKCTEEVCESAYQVAIVGATEEEKKWYGRMRENCNDNRRMAGRPLAHNQNFLFAMVLIELWRALDSTFYQQSPDRSPDAEPQRRLIPLLISRMQRYFVNRLRLITSDTNVEFYFWHGGDDLPDGVHYHSEDTHHGAVTIRYLDVLRRNLDRLNEYAAEDGEPIPLDGSHLLRFANTFLWKIAKARDFAGDITGEPPDENINGDTGGWVTLAVARDEVYQTCHNVWTRTVGGTQPYLNITTHSLLLANKQFAGRYRYYERTRAVGAPKAAGSPSAIVFPPPGETRVVYRDTVGQLYELWQRGIESGARDLTLLADNAIRAEGDPTLYVDTAGGMLVAPYLGTDGRVYSIWWNANQIGRDSLSASSPGAPASAGNPIGYVQADGTNNVVYRTGSDRLHELWWTGQNTPGNGTLTPNDAPLVDGDPAPCVNPNTGGNLVVYRTPVGDIHTLFWTVGEVGHENLLDSSWHRAAGDLVVYYTSWDDVLQITYRCLAGHIHELWWKGEDAVSHWIPSLSAGAPAAASDPAAYYSSGTHTKHIFYRGVDQHLHEIWWNPSLANAAHVDVTFQARAPLATGKPAAFTVEGPNTHHVVYRGTDGEIHEIRWV